MRLSPQEFSHLEEMDVEGMSVEAFPWIESWEESASLFEPLEPLTPSQEQLLVIDTLNNLLPDEAEFEPFDDFALGEY